MSATATAAASGGPVTDLAGLQARLGLDSAAVGRLRRFARERGVPESRLVAVGLQDRYQGAEKVAAMTTYAILFDAAHHGKVSPDRARRIIEHVLPALEQGKVGIRLRPLTGASASYNGRNTGNADGFEANTLYLPCEGIDITERHQRGIVVHEADHIARDAARERRTLLESERAGHLAFADYMLRDSGAVVATRDGLRLDYVAFDRVQAGVTGAADRKLLFELLAEVAQRNADAGRHDLNGAYGVEYGDQVGPAIAEQSGKKGSFEKVYLEAIANDFHLSGGQTVDALERRYAQPAAADGL